MAATPQISDSDTIYAGDMLNLPCSDSSFGSGGSSGSFSGSTSSTSNGSETGSKSDASGNWRISC